MKTKIMLLIIAGVILIPLLGFSIYMIVKLSNKPKSPPSSPPPAPPPPASPPVSPISKIVTNCSPLKNPPDSFVQGNCNKDELCTQSGCSPRCYRDSDCNVYKTLLPDDDTLQWVCQNYGNPNGEQKFCQVVPNPRLTDKNYNNLIKKSMKNCQKIYKRAGTISRKPYDYCYNVDNT